MNGLVRNIDSLNLTSLSAIVLVSLTLVSCSSPTKYPLRESHASSKAKPFTTPNRQASTIMNSSDGCTKLYRVKNGDSLSEIAQKCDVSMNLLAKANGLFPPYVIYKNQEIVIPDKAPRYDASEIASKPSIKSATVANPTPKPVVKTTSWQWPVHQNAPHRFIRDNAGLSIVEIYGLSGQEVNAVAPGEVVYSGNGIINFGLMVVIKHDDEYMSIYAHNSALLVKEGQRVKAGQQIAFLGATGNTDRPKLYLEARYHGRKIDILKVLAKPKSS